MKSGLDLISTREIRARERDANDEPFLRGRVSSELLNVHRVRINFMWTVRSNNVGMIVRSEERRVGKECLL